MRTILALLLLAPLSLGLIGCFDNPDPACAFACGGEGDDECPDGYACIAGAAEGDPSICVREDLQDDGLAACETDEEL